MNQPQHIAEDMLLPKDKAAEWYSIQRELQSFQNKAVLGRCMFWPEDCESKPDGSHLISCTWLRKISASNNKVLEFEFSTAQLTTRPARFRAKPAGVNLTSSLDERKA
jgi:hypothetical protein